MSCRLQTQEYHCVRCLSAVTFYGQSLMNTTVVNNAVASTSGLNSITALRQSLLGTIYVMLIALPGYWWV